MKRSLGLRLGKTIEVEVGNWAGPVCFKLEPKTLLELNRLCRELGLDSRSELIRKMIEYALEHLDDFRRWLGR